jgi:hypothetical protein
MSEHREPVSASQARRAGTNHSNGLFRRCSSDKERSILIQSLINGVTLKQPYAHGPIIRLVTYACVFAQRLNRADSGTSAAHNIFLQYKARRTHRIVITDHTDKTGDIYLGRTSLRARGIETEITPLGLDPRAVRFQG